MDGPCISLFFTNEYFLNKALQLESLGADMITLKDIEWFDTSGSYGGIGAIVQEEPEGTGGFPYA